jgi:hypothetical protein
MSSTAVDDDIDNEPDYERTERDVNDHALWHPHEYPTPAVQHIVGAPSQNGHSNGVERGTLRVPSSSASSVAGVPSQSVASSPMLAPYPATPLPSLPLPSFGTPTTNNAPPPSSSAAAVPSPAQQRSLAELTNQFRDLVRSMEMTPSLAPSSTTGAVPPPTVAI